MPQPTWITPSGSLGVIPEGVFYSVPVQAVADDEDVYFRLIAGELPEGIQVTDNGIIEGVPKSSIIVQGVPQEVNRDVTSKFAIRAYTVKIVNGNILVDRLADRTFSLTVSGEDAPSFITPSGNVGTFYDGTQATVQIDFYDADLEDQVSIRLLSGELPPGLALDEKTGLISGVIIPLIGPPGTANGGYSMTDYDQYPFDFMSRAASKNFQFTLELTDGKNSSVRTFEIYVYAKSTMLADTTIYTADNTFITADVTPDHPPLIITPEGSIGRVRADNWYAFKFDAIDFDGDGIEYVLDLGPVPVYPSDNIIRFYGLPPGLIFDNDTGWLYGYIPDQGATEFNYAFGVKVKQKIEPAAAWDPLASYQAGNIVTYLGQNYTALVDTVPGLSPSNSGYWALNQIPSSKWYYYSITVVGFTDTQTTWLTDPDLGNINNGEISTLYVAATNVGGRSLQYRMLQPGSNLPQGLTLQPSGNITGRVSFNTFAIDGGTTTFDVNPNNQSITSPTTFDSTFRFTVNAYAPETDQILYKVKSILVTDRGGSYTSQPTITISAPPSTADSVQATAGLATIVNGMITSIALDNPGQGYTSIPTVTITGGGGTGATAVCTIIQSQVVNAISVYRTFTIHVVREFNEPYETLYVKCMPPLEDRALVSQLIQNQDIIPVNLIYRADDPNFGVAQNVTYDHAYGLTASTYSEYMASLAINHYWKNVTLGEIRTARALGNDGTVLYEVVYSVVVDDLVNSAGQSVGKEVTLPYPVSLDVGDDITQVYPNSLINMRNQVIDSVGQISPALPLWMTSKQSNGQVLGFVPAWVIAYVKPGESSRIAYNIRENFGRKLNLVDFKIDRYELDRSQTHNWDASTQEWIPHPPLSTTFDIYTEYLYTSLYSQFGIYGFVLEVRTFSGDGATTDFSITPLNYDTLLVTVNDIAQILGVDYDIDYGFRTQTAMFAAAPAPGDSVKIYQISGSWVLDPNSLPSGDATTFDGGATTFNSPADRWVNTDAYDKYLVFPRTNILD